MQKVGLIRRMKPKVQRHVTRAIGVGRVLLAFRCEGGHLERYNVNNNDEHQQQRRSQ
jgi:hypothetical protein